MMMEDAMKIEVLKTVANMLNSNKLIWGLGGSAMLYLRGYVNSFNDIDIFVREDDFLKVKSVLLNNGDLKDDKPNEKYISRYFSSFEINYVVVNVTAGFTIEKGANMYYFPLKEEKLKDIVSLGATTIPLMTLEEWREYYTLSDKPDKVQIIDNYLNKSDN